MRTDGWPWLTISHQSRLGSVHLQHRSFSVAFELDTRKVSAPRGCIVVGGRASDLSPCCTAPHEWWMSILL